MGTKNIRKTESQRLGDIGESEIQTIFTRQGWTVTPIEGQADFGEDQLVKVFIDGEATELFFFTQVKSVHEARKLKTFDGFSVPIRSALLDVWYGHTAPVFLILWDEKGQCAYWVEIHEYLKSLETRNITWQSKKKHPVRISARDQLDDEGLVKLEKIVRDWYLKFAFQIRGEKALEINARFEFSDNEEGRKTFDEFDKCFKTGAQVEVEGKYIKQFEFSDWYKRLAQLPEFTENTRLIISPSSGSEIYPAKIEFLSDRNGTLAFDYIALKVQQAGSEEVTLSNKDQVSPLQIRIVANSETRQIRASFSFSFYGKDLETACKLLKLAEIISCGCLARIIDLKMGETIVEQQIKHEFLPGYIELGSFFEMLRAIETKTGKKIIIPQEGLTEADIQNALELYQVTATGRIRRTFKRFYIDIRPSALVNLIMEEKLHPGRFLMESEESYIELFGEKYLLGPMTRTLESIQVRDDLGEILKTVNAIEDEDYFRLEFVPASSDKYEEVFPNWLSENNGA